MSKARRFLTPVVLAPVAVALLTFASLISPAMGASPTPGPAAENPFIYVGTYTTKASKGIYVMHMDPATGALSEPQLAGQAKSPSFLAIHPSKRFLYAVNEVSSFDGKKSGAVSAFAIEPKTGSLTLLNQQPSGGDGPCYVGLDRTGKVAFAANYGSGSVASYAIGEDGRLQAPATIDQHRGKGATSRQDGPHAHCFDVDPANRFALANDLGLDRIFVYRFDLASGRLTPNAPPTASLSPGSGPRHLTFSPDGKFVYCINELASTVTALRYASETGVLTEVQTVSTLPAEFHGGNTTAEVIIHPSGKFLYGSNRGHNSIAIFKVDAASGKLTPTGHESTQGKTPRGFNVDPTGKFLVAGNQDTDNIASFAIDPQSGALKATGSTVQVSMPVHILFMANGQ